MLVVEESILFDYYFFVLNKLYSYENHCFLKYVVAFLLTQIFFIVDAKSC